MNKFSPLRTTRSVDEITGSRRLRRMRKADWSRRLVQENRLTVDDLIWPIFLSTAKCARADPGHARRLPPQRRSRGQGSRARGKARHPGLATFPNIDGARKDITGSHILDPDNLINQATRAIKARRAGNRRHHRRRARPVHQPRP
jgi:porphobilinogen synthase